jgi:Bacterial TSP3 repeat
MASILVTGISKGIGRATALVLGRAGRTAYTTMRLWAVCTILAGVALAGGVVPARAAPTAGEIASAKAALTSGCPTHTYLGNNPDGTDWPDWSEQAQGVANDGKHWFFTSMTGGLFKYDANWLPIDGDDIGKLGHVGFPPELGSMGIDHFGDPDYYAGYVFVPFEHNDDDPAKQKAIIGVFRASDLAFVDWVDMLPFQPKAGWVAIDPVEEILYTSNDRLVAGTPLLRYKVDLSKLENGIPHDFLTPTTSIAVLDADGSPVSGKFIYIQGGVFTPWRDLYLSVGMADETPEKTRGGLHLFRRTSDGSAFQLVESSVNVSDHVGEPVFAYEYHPGSSIDPEEEPEGIDWWNRDNVPGSFYKGQLHAILLDNDLNSWDDDKIWLKHYRVDYFCAANTDTDRDGLTDRDEAYIYNTHPLLSDTDRDGQSDGGEVVCGSDPLDPSSLAPDLDGDHAPDCVDPDDDGDGQSDADELACGSNPRDAASLSPDFDKDGIPNCSDQDDDNDGVADEQDRCAGTLIPDPVIPTSGTLKNNRYALLDGDLVFDGGGATPLYTTIKTGGCNATQIADAMGLGVSHYEYGITRSVLDTWIASQP